MVGFDNYTFARNTSLQLTTVEVNMDEMAESAVQLLVRHIDGCEEKGRKVISGKLIIRDSVVKRKQS